MFRNISILLKKKANKINNKNKIFLKGIFV